MSFASKVDGSKRVKLSDFDPDLCGGITRVEGERRSAELGAELTQLHELLYAAGKTGLLIVLQARDTGGKDGLIRFLSNYLNAQSCHVEPFKAPTPLEVSHDFLWRIHPHVPARGSISIFNRSHYEDVLIVRVHNLVPETVWKRRFDHINNFENMLMDHDTVVLKFYLNISKSEQAARLADREKDPTKAWKLAVADWEEREVWDKYTGAYEDVLEKCASPRSPWYIVPANRKWFRNLAVTEMIVETLRPYKKQWMTALDKMGDNAKKDIAAYKTAHQKTDI